MNRAASLALALTAALLAAAPALAASPCDRLAARAKGLPAGAWSGGSRALKPWLRIDEGREAKGPLEAGLVADPAVREAIGTEFGSSSVFVDRLAESDLYAAWTLQGTAHCQTIAFVRLGPGGRARIVDAPKGKGGTDEDGDLCWTRGGSFGRVLGQPVYVESGDNDQWTYDEDIAITPWAGGRWGGTCTLKLRYRTAFGLSDRKCRDAALCAALDGKVLALTAAYDRHLLSHANTPFRYGAQTVPAAIKAAVEADRPLTDVPDWPGFGERPDDRAVSYEGLAYFPLTVGGRAYVGAMTHEGVGWRANNTELLVVYTLQKGVLQAQAAYAVDRSIAGLSQVSASD